MSGLSVYVPSPCVSLPEWAQWYGHSPAKVEAVVGDEFRMCGPTENAYTMAASAVYRLLRAYKLDPRRVRSVSLGTESSTDNAAGAVIVRGLVDRALVDSGSPPLPRSCEVPEFKHACLGGMYALKSALRATASSSGQDDVAIVVASDIAEYAPGSTGEPTQGAGAVAMLVEKDPTLFSVDLPSAGSASAYRIADFRKPFSRHFVGTGPALGSRWKDYPVFNGRYSTLCYMDTVLRAFCDLVERRPTSDVSNPLSDARALFLHRPYHHLPAQAVAFLAAAMLARSSDKEERNAFADLCETAGVSVGDAERAFDIGPAELTSVALGETPGNPLQAAQRVSKQLAQTSRFRDFREEKLGLGAAGMRRLGNLYTASIFGWLASGFDEALRNGVELAGAEFLAIGYGSGDAAECWSLRVRPEWKAPAGSIHFEQALADPHPLNKDEYEALHRGRQVELPRPPFCAIASTGTRTGGDWQDTGIDYYTVTTQDPMGDESAT